MKKMILIAGLLVLLLGGGAGAYFFFLMPDPVASEEMDDEEKVKKIHKAEADKDTKEYIDAKPEKIFLELHQIVLPIIDDKGVKKAVTMKVTLEVNDYFKLAELAKIKPKLTSVFLRDAHSLLHHPHFMSRDEIPVAFFEQRLQKTLNATMDAPIIDNVVLKMVNQRPI